MLRQALRQAAANAKQLCVSELLHAHNSVSVMKVKARTAMDLLIVAGCDTAHI